MDRRAYADFPAASRASSPQKNLRARGDMQKSLQIPVDSAASKHTRPARSQDARTMTSHTTHRILASIMAFAAGALATSASAQYSSDPTTPLAIRATALDDVQAKIAPGPNGSQYISYFSDAGYDVYIDRLDASGHSMWSAPVLVEDRAFSSTVDYGMASDASGNAYISYNSLAKNGTDPAQKVASIGPDGAIRWKTIFYTAPSVSLGNGRVTVASDGFVWGATSVGFDSAIARLDPTTGAMSFTPATYITETSAKQICSGLQPSTDGTVILSTVRYTTTFSNKILRAHKIATDGTRPWAAAGVPVASTGNIQTGNFPDFISDGSGGAYFSWYTTNPLTCRVQHMDSTGAMTFGTDGFAVGTSTTASFGGTTATLNRTNPSTVRGADGRVYCFFRAYSGSIAGIVWYGIGAQCFNTDGTTAWGTDGVMVEDYLPSSAGSVYDRQVGSAINFGNGIGCSYVDAATAVDNTAMAVRMNSDGTLAWRTTVASNSGVKYRFVSSTAPSNAAVLAWQGGRTIGASDIYCARVDSTGVLGAPAGITGDLNGDGHVNASDLATLLNQWGGPGSADFDQDGAVSASDLATLLNNWTN